MLACLFESLNKLDMDCRNDFFPLLDFGFQGWSLKATLKKLSVAAESASHLLWMTHSHTLPPSTMPKYS